MKNFKLCKIVIINKNEEIDLAKPISKENQTNIYYQFFCFIL